MRDFKQPTLEERRAMAAKAKQAQLEAARAKAPANDPQFAERQAARLAAAEARDVAPEGAQGRALWPKRNAKRSPRPRPRPNG